MSLEVSGLSKRFGKLMALDHVNVHLEKGKIYGLLGRNGAGKSTLLNILNGRMQPTDGSFTIDGEKPGNDRALRKIYMVGPDNLFPAKKLKDILKITATFYPNFALNEALADLDRFGLSPESRFDKLSTGNSSLFKSVVALRSGAEYLFLDEPTLGHDAVNREMFYENVLSVFAKTQNCIVLSSHLISELAPLLQEVIFIQKGKILIQEELDALMEKYRLLTATTEQVQNLVQAHPEMTVVQKQEVGAMAQWVVESDVWAALSTASLGISLQNVDLQRLFIALTKEQPNTAAKNTSQRRSFFGPSKKDEQQ